jgi:hypothetical protein
LILLNHSFLFFSINSDEKERKYRELLERNDKLTTEILRLRNHSKHLQHQLSAVISWKVTKLSCGIDSSTQTDAVNIVNTEEDYVPGSLLKAIKKKESPRIKLDNEFQSEKKKEKVKKTPVLPSLVPPPIIKQQSTEESLSQAALFTPPPSVVSLPPLVTPTKVYSFENGGESPKPPTPTSQERVTKTLTTRIENDTPNRRRSSSRIMGTPLMNYKEPSLMVKVRKGFVFFKPKDPTVPETPLTLDIVPPVTPVADALTMMKVEDKTPKRRSLKKKDSKLNWEETEGMEKESEIQFFLFPIVSTAEK